MPLSVGGGQLPVSAFFGSSANRSAKPQLKRRHSSPRQQAVPPKKRKQKENLTPSGSRNIGHVVAKTTGHDVGSSQPRPRRSTGTANEVDMGTARVEKEKPTLENGLNGPPSKADSGCAVIDLTDDRPGDIVPQPRPVYRLETPPLTPEGRGRRRDLGSIVSLPSPPLTAHDARKLRKRGNDSEKQEENVQKLPHALVDHDASPGAAGVKASMQASQSSGTPLQDQTIEHKDPCSLTRPTNDRDLMPPPPLPFKALLHSSPASSLTMPTLSSSPAYRPHPSSPIRWVPSSQTQELSIPRITGLPDRHSSDETRRGRRRSATQVVPSSQPDERELELPSGSSDHCDVHQLRACEARPGPNPLQASDTDEGHAHDTSPGELIESSQSQFEVEITPAWAERIATRRAELCGSKQEQQAGGSSLSPSSPPRAAETQDYDAESEYSSSVDEVSQSSVSGQSGPRSSTPSQYRRFCEMFEGRDDDGNELPREETASARRSRSASPTWDRGRDACERACSPLPSSSPSARSDRHIPREEATASPQAECAVDGESSYGSSYSETTPTAFREYWEMFSDSQIQDAPEYPPSQVQDDEGGVEGF
ncbi:hypothetical protein DICSQDRAFT_179560 [Dichomitus squalens LYAD-421 SS1]|uniref:uncharacterized protein n=1 Tax=Dichomitus squalens (strain LYAD-421) TaxID=732165 RepID=UPI0004412612|nr:uncharacterized protein DICSQDRAFT_179560 [Dichomitus squalens LYAD-421 SS1]EJF62854.1 hypothetical protein DICSQDRAFT_179560 [Dichomitus squalens LYAD-421 SS1]